ncbi:hypothetical protein ACFRAM_10145 [Paenibacillus sp. NPDC056722]|uniref:hypothetical protein n=1 Tax=Paenibacillus sp. NPDC056722 TaxID=3345924 RepID=UPI0036C4E66F
MLVNIECPVECLDYDLYESRSTGKIYCSLMFNNLSSRTVKGLKIIIYCYDQFGDPVEDERNTFECKIEFKDGLPPSFRQFTDKKLELAVDQNTRKIEVDIVKILFDDNSMWNNDTSSSEKIELVKVGDPKLLAFVQARAGDDAKYLANEFDERWICICGRLNVGDHLTCKRCRRNKENVLTDYKEEETIIRNLRVFEEEKAKKQMEEREKNEQQLKRNKEKQKRIIKNSSYIAAILLVTAVISFGFLTKFTFSIKNHQASTDENNNKVTFETIPVVEAEKEPEPEKQLVEDSLKADLVEEVIHTSFVSNGGNNGRGEFEVEYRKEGVVKTKLISDIFEPKSVDIDHDGVNEFVISYRIDVDNLSNAQMPYWDDVYEFDVNKEDLVLVSNKYSEYYKNNYIPSLKKKVTESSDLGEKQALFVLIQAANDLFEGNFIPDVNQEKIDSLVQDHQIVSPLKIVKQGNKFYIHGITLGMNIKEAIKLLGNPDDSFEVDSKVAIWNLKDNLKLTVEYVIDTIDYLDLGEFDQWTQDQSMSALGNPAEVGEEEYSYLTSTQRLRFHTMVKSGEFRVQLMDPEIL